ncbi:MAG TPA: carbon-nitrogen hydrolase family protein [Casimicrobiaceae bacterium]|jgi:nitrilase|nr:carbon-nitrogen hydrolase family protein [Casimicrobiaceae bacterium]
MTAAANPAMRVAAIQMNSGADVDANLRQADALLAQAAAAGATLAVLPENFGLMGAHARDKLAAQERDGAGVQQEFLANAARRHRIHLIGGSVPLASAVADRVWQALVAYGPDGRRSARYDKIHLFRFSDGDEDYDEARTIVPGDSPAWLETSAGRVGLSICYDLRFPELYRSFGDVVLIVVPAAFTFRTGEAHWETLLRARAIENQCYVAAAAQTGSHPGGRRTWGHSMIVDPWGVVVASRAEEPGFVLADIDPLRIADVRRRLPALEHRSTIDVR